MIGIDIMPLGTWGEWASAIAAVALIAVTLGLWRHEVAERRRDDERRHRAAAAEKAFRTLVGNHPPSGRDVSAEEAAAINIELTVVGALSQDSEFAARMNGTKAVLWVLANRVGVAGHGGINLIRSSVIENLINACNHQLFAFWLDRIPPAWQVEIATGGAIDAPRDGDLDAAQAWLSRYLDAVFESAATTPPTTP